MMTFAGSTLATGSACSTAVRTAPGLQPGLRQRLTLTPQMLEAMRLLTHAGADLNRYVDQQLASNPLLDRTAPEHHGQPAPPLDSWSDAGVPWARPPPGGEALTEDLASRPPDLREHLTGQAHIDLPPADHGTAEQLIDLVDANGYLAEFDAVEVAELARTTVADVLRVLARLQACDPPGVCARSLSECLRLQLHARDRVSRKMLLLVDHLELVGSGDLDQLRIVLDVSVDRLQALLADLRSLNPKPGQAFAHEPEWPGAPDVVATPAGRGWQILLNPVCFPRVYADQAGYRAARACAPAGTGDGVIARQWQEATWLVRALRQRAQSIYRVASVLVRLQDAYVRHGASRRRPLSLRAVAELVDLHESTVSRVVANKTMAVPRGTLPLRSFFDRGLGGTRARPAHATSAVRARIQSLIEAEGPDCPPRSDQEIVAVLAESGIRIARRTVSKYRKMMRIPASAKRLAQIREARQQTPDATAGRPMGPP